MSEMRKRSETERKGRRSTGDECTVSTADEKKTPKGRKKRRKRTAMKRAELLFGISFIRTLLLALPQPAQHIP